MTVVGGRKVCKTCTEGCHAKLRDIYGCNVARISLRLLGKTEENNDRFLDRNVKPGPTK